jgi:hypothetical protein
MGCAALVGAAIALPAGMSLADREEVREGQAPAARSKAAGATGREIYSPTIHSDPYVLDQQRKVVEALESQCRHQGERCAEAARARRWLNERARE